MLTITLISLLGSFAFRKEIMRKGYNEPKVWRFPVLVGAILILFSYMTSFVISRLIKSEMTLQVLPTLITILTLTIQCALLAKSWKQIKVLPDQSDHRSE